MSSRGTLVITKSTLTAMESAVGAVSRRRRAATWPFRLSMSRQSRSLRCCASRYLNAARRHSSDSATASAMSTIRNPRTGTKTRWEMTVPIPRTLETVTPSPTVALPERSRTRISKAKATSRSSRFQAEKAPTRPWMKNRSMSHRRFAR